jgi:hypothetical protein
VKTVARDLRAFTAPVCATLFGASLLYLAYDILFGRNLLSYNLLLFGHEAFERSVDYDNAHFGLGRGFSEMLGFVMGFLPFFLADRLRGAPKAWLWALWVVVALLVFNETGSGRQYLLVAIAAFAAGRSSSLRRMVWTGCVLLASFAFVSFARGDFDHSDLGNPLFDGMAFPYINLALMLNTECGTGTWYGYAGEFFKKFLPAFIFPKSIFSFNVEMSLCIYPFMGNAVNSVSIFTYLGEFYYYRPPIVTALLAGVLIGLLTRLVDRWLVEANLMATRIFTGIMCVGMLRSRTQDLLSFLLSLAIFLLLVRPLLAGSNRAVRAGKSEQTGSGFGTAVSAPQPAP